MTGPRVGRVLRWTLVAVVTSVDSLRPASVPPWTGTATERGNGSGTVATYNGA